MTALANIFNDKSSKPKDKTIAVSELLLENKLSIATIIEFCSRQKDPVKASCVEAIEFASKIQPGIATEDCLVFVTNTLTDKAPRIKWESAKVIGNIAQLFPGKLDDAIKNLLINTEHNGTVVRWSAAYALSQIILINNQQSKKLIPAIEAIINREEKNSIKKIYAAALKKVK